MTSSYAHSDDHDHDDHGYNDGHDHGHTYVDGELVQEIHYMKPYGTPANFANQLTVGFSRYAGDPINGSIEPTSAGVITYNISKLSNAGQWFAKKAFSAWAAVSDLKFVQTNSGNAKISFQQSDQSGAYAITNYSGNEITKASVNIPTSWYAGEGYQINSYGYQTFLHEIGHTLGLGHAGNYNGDAVFGTDAKFRNDSWQMSVMSYFSQSENPNVNASEAFVLTPMKADIAAIQKLYGAPSSVNGGNTTYGFKSNAEGVAKLFASQSPAMTMTIYDSAGTDTLNFTKTSSAQKINMAQGSISSVLGKQGNLIINNGTYVENAAGGRGTDRIEGNTLNNRIDGNSGSDSIFGRKGNDILNGGAGSDRLFGGDGNDTISGKKHSDTIAGGGGNDVIRGGSGSDNIRGGSGNDVMNGGGGRDKIKGGGGYDVVYGKGGADTFVFGKGSGVDVIADFRQGQGDEILLARKLLGGKNLSKFMSDNAEYDGSGTVITFASGEKLIVKGVSNPMNLVDDISLF